MRGAAARTPLRFGRLRWAVPIAALALLSFGANARASTVTVGSPISTFFGEEEYSTVATVVNSRLPEAGANVFSPVSGAVIRWRVFLAEGGPFRLRVLRHVGGTTFTGAGTSGPETPSGSLGFPDTFATNLPIQAGDTIAINNSATTDMIGVASSLAGAQFLAWVAPLSNGSTRAATEAIPEREVAFNADVQPRPSVSSINPSSGPSAGGTDVTIAGSDFADVSAVDFGGHPAASYSIDSESQIVAKSPSAPPGPVDVTVTTVAGKSATGSADVFTFNPPLAPVLPAAGPVCRVPKLKHRKLKAAKRVLRKRHCRIGKVIRKHRKKAPRKARVFKQRPRPRTVRPAGAKVHVWLRVRKKHRKNSAR